MVKNLPDSAGDACGTPGSGKSLEKKMATHSCILAWEIPWREEPWGLQSMGGRKRVGYDFVTKQQEPSNWSGRDRNGREIKLCILFEIRTKGLLGRFF